MKKIIISHENVKKHFYIESLSEKSNLQHFNCHLVEYTDYLLKDAMRSKNDHIAKTWLLYEIKSEERKTLSAPDGRGIS